MLGNSIVVRAHKEKLLAITMITMTKSIQRFPCLSYMGMGLYLVALWAAKPLLKMPQKITCLLTIFMEHGIIMAHNPWWLNQ